MTGARRILAKPRVAIVISGRGSNMAALIYAAKADECAFEVAAVIGEPESAGLALAAAEGVETVRLPAPARNDKSAFFAALEAALDDIDPDCIALAGFMHIVPLGIVDRWRGRMLNIHPSLLPKYRGLNTHRKAIEAGDKVAGCSVHLVTPELDAGAVLGQTEVAVLPGDTPEALAARVLIAEHQLYPRVLGAFVGRERDADWIIARVGGLALALPQTHARTSHGAPGWRVGSETTGKFFAYVSVRHHGEDAVALLVKTSGPDEMNALIEAEPDVYYRPAYYGASGWIALRLDRSGVDWDHVEAWLAKSWRAVAPARMSRFLNIADEF